MAAALLTLTTLSVLGLGTSLLVALELIPLGESHARIAVFATMLNLLAHSFLMFYLIGKGKAIREAVVEAGLDGEYVRRVSRLRGPVFSKATIAMAVTMVAGFMGASADVRALPVLPHALLAGLAVAFQVHAIHIEALALTGISHIVDEVNARLAHG
jgi:hypothetical protein